MVAVNYRFALYEGDDYSKIWTPVVPMSIKLIESQAFPYTTVPRRRSEWRNNMLTYDLTDAQQLLHTAQVLFPGALFGLVGVPDVHLSQVRA